MFHVRGFLRHFLLLYHLKRQCAPRSESVSEAKTEIICLMTEGVDRVTFVSEAAGQV